VPVVLKLKIFSKRKKLLKLRVFFEKLRWFSG
jgi:hypothetical protein